MEDEESLETCALISQFADPVKNQVNNLLPNGVVTASIVVGSIFLPSDELFWVEQLAVCASAYLVYKNEGIALSQTITINNAVLGVGLLNKLCCRETPRRFL